jgi:hypothetical protein
MSDVQQIEAAIRRDQLFSCSAQLSTALGKLFEADDFWTHRFLKLHENYVLKAQKNSKQAEPKVFAQSPFWQTNSVVGLLWIWATFVKSEAEKNIPHFRETGRASRKWGAIARFA